MGGLPRLSSAVTADLGADRSAGLMGPLGLDSGDAGDPPAEPSPLEGAAHGQMREAVVLGMSEAERLRRADEAVSRVGAGGSHMSRRRPKRSGAATGGSRRGRGRRTPSRVPPPSSGVPWRDLAMRMPRPVSRRLSVWSAVPMGVAVAHFGRGRRSPGELVARLANRGPADGPMRGPALGGPGRRALPLDVGRQAAVLRRGLHTAPGRVTDVARGGDIRPGRGGQLAAFELLARSLQLIELKYKDGGPFEDSRLYLGLSQTRGVLMVCPALERYVGTSLKRELKAAEAWRNAHEERQMRALRK